MPSPNPLPGWAAGLPAFRTSPARGSGRKTIASSPIRLLGRSAVVAEEAVVARHQVRPHQLNRNLTSLENLTRGVLVVEDEILGVVVAEQVGQDVTPAIA